jgi:hypothetical protein
MEELTKKLRMMNVTEPTYAALFTHLKAMGPALVEGVPTPQ